MHCDDDDACPRRVFACFDDVSNESPDDAVSCVEVVCGMPDVCWNN
jgi:hypothetical protein